MKWNKRKWNETKENEIKQKKMKENERKWNEKKWNKIESIYHSSIHRLNIDYKYYLDDDAFSWIVCEGNPCRLDNSFSGFNSF
jgi:hypothetical protein